MRTENISKLSDKQLAAFLKKNSLSLTVQEARSIVKKLSRDPTMTELHIFNIQWSEHSSYKSSRPILKMLPTEASNVILGPKEDSGIVFLTEHRGERYGIVMSHESHNHPSQVVPFEGAATGIGGIMRDVLCMGADIIATADPLRFGNTFGENKNRTRYVANEVVNGIAGYGNPVGIPVLAGDLYFDDSFDDNCLVNVVCLGLVKEKDIIHSYAPENAVGYDVIVVGKATDNSGFGGASFASLTLDEQAKESNRGAVQVPDPFLKNMLLRATAQVFKEVRKDNIPVGFKDMGAGGIMCATSELGSAAGFGIELIIDDIHTAFEMDPWVTACSETQERFTWVVPPSFTSKLLRIYNEDFALPEIAEKAQAKVIGKITRNPDYRLWYKDELVCDAPIMEVTSGVTYRRKAKAPKRTFKESKLRDIDLDKAFLSMLSHPNICSRHHIYEHYDTSVIGRTVFPPGKADAGLLAPLPGSKVGVALSTDAVPRYGKIDPYWAGINAVAEAMRNVACIGAKPVAMTDCLNFGNPEKPQYFWEFVQAVKGISHAARKIGKPFSKEPIPFISGNVSFYNESSKGSSVAPSPVIACLGIMDDYKKAITPGLKKEGSGLILIGKRNNELGGSVFYHLHGELGKNVPKPVLKEERGKMEFVIEAIDKGLLLSCHDISDGGLACCLAEMAIMGGLGVDVSLPNGELASLLFSESPGYVIEVDSKKMMAVKRMLQERGLWHHNLGKTCRDDFMIKGLRNQPVANLKEAWQNSLKEAMS
ncbi:MAG: phosphoribosylformylglycinamidine synthase subunit PurL [Nanoarchaeota archaeon]|nr:phosphoribosylformylglycinamidine synthase subunit PurL [Nanoarchaeota archaeon]